MCVQWGPALTPKLQGIFETYDMDAPWTHAVWRQLSEVPEIGTVLETGCRMVAAQGQGRKNSEMII